MKLKESDYFNFYCNPEIETSNSGVFEWLDICETIELARDQYTFMELGAGYARWSVLAYAISRRMRSIPTRLIMVEAEPTHLKWARENLTINQVPEQDFHLISGAAGTHEGYVWFEQGKPEECYGQTILEKNFVSLTWIKFKAALAYLLGQVRYSTQLAQNYLLVKSYSLKELLKKTDTVDLIHMDLQGYEYKVLSSASEILNQKVKRLHIGTHSQSIEEDLRILLDRLGWKCLQDYPCQGTHSTPFGHLEFEDGIQTWVNPRF